MPVDVELQSIFDGLFIHPYEHERWLKDQGILIERLKEIGIDTTNLEAMQKGRQCSILIPEIYREKKNLTNEPSDDINKDVVQSLTLGQ